MTPEQQRITDLERENQKLKAKLKKAGLMPQAVPLPDDSEVTRLLALVEAAHPALKPPPNETGHRRHFINAIHYLTFAYRSDQFSSYATTVFLDDCSVWLQKFDIAGGVALRAFVCAAIAQRFIYSNPEQFPYQIELGIGLGASARPFAGWKFTLRDGVPAPTVSKKHVTPVVQQLDLTPGMRTVRGSW
jgi:hypothetical protein